MRSGSTALRPIRSRPRGVRGLQFVLIGMLAMASLAGCSTGGAERSEEAATRDAVQSTNVVANIEETQIIREFFAPTETPPPYPTVIPSLANLRLTTELRDQDQPGQTIYTYNRSGGTLYADAQVANIGPGQTVIALWMRNGDVVDTTEVNIENQRELVWIPLSWNNASSASSGEYAVVIQVRGPGTNDDGTPSEVTTEIGSLVFRVN